MSRVIIAFVIAPPVPLLLPAFALLVTGGARADLLLHTFLVSLYAYLPALVFGLPLYLMAQKKAWLGWWQMVLAGCLIGVVSALLVFAGIAAFFSIANGHPVPMSGDTMTILVPMMASGFLYGGLSGIVFALIVRRSLRSHSAVQSDARHEPVARG